MPRSPEPVRLTVTRYVDRDGRRVTKATPGARKITGRTEEYYARVGPKKGGRHQPVPLGTSNKALAWARLRELLRKQEERRLGIRDDFTEAAEVPWETHVRDWLDAVRTKRTGEAEIRLKRGRLAELRRLAGWKRITDITEDGAAEALARVQETPAPGKTKPRGAQTRNHYRAHVRQFTRWLARRGRLARDPLADLPRVSVEKDRRHDRREPADWEVAKLLGEVDRPDAPVRRGMTGPQRALGYRVAMATGFRAGELRRLTPESFDLGAGTVTGRAAYSKNGKAATQHLPPWLVAELRVWLSGGGGLWEGFPRQFPGRVLKADLKRAGVPWEAWVDGVPLYFDFHALRVWYISWAASLPGISPKTLMEMARHSDPRLTLRTYAKARREEVRATVRQMPRPGEVASKVASNKRSGGKTG